MEVLQQNIDVLLHLLLDCLAVHGHDEGVDVAEGDENDGGADGGPLHAVAQRQDPLGVHGQGLGQGVVLVPLQHLEIQKVQSEGL